MISGSVVSANRLEEFTYTFVKRDDTVLTPATSIAVNADNTFSTTVKANAELGSIILQASDEAGKTSSYTYAAHVGYKYHYLLAGPPASGNTTDADAMPFFSAQLGKMLSFCEAQDNPALVDFGFAIWSSNKQIRMNDLESSDKFKSNSCGTYNSSGALQWSSINVYALHESAIAWSNFEKASITEIKADAGTAPAQRGINLYVDLTTTPKPDKVAIYEATIKGEKKKVLIAIDKIEDGAGTTVTFWVKCKVEI